MTGIVGAFQEAWGEVRVHRARVVLSLVGVVIAVFAMTIVTAAGTIGRQVLLESGERDSGRSTPLSIYASALDGQSAPERATTVLTGLVDRYGAQYSSLVLQTGLQSGPIDAPTFADLILVEPDYGIIHRLRPVSGRWLVAADERRLAPAAVVNTFVLEQNGMAGRQPPFTLPLPDNSGLSVTVVGVLDRNNYGAQFMMLTGVTPLLDELVVQNIFPNLEMWVPPGEADRMAREIPAILQSQGMQGEAFPTSDPGLPRIITAAQWVIRGMSLFALFLGTLGVLNVGIVTVRQRIREIGVRRALGASSARVFAAVVLESVCATALAGAIGVAAAVAVFTNAPLDQLLGEFEIADVPPFPVSAAIEAFVAAVLVGALAGLVPATIAVRSKVIDAIRY